MILHKDMSLRELDDFCQFAWEQGGKIKTVKVHPTVMDRIYKLTKSTQYMGISFKTKS